MAQVGTFMKCWFLMEIRIFGNYRGAALYLLLHFNNGKWYFVSFFFLLLLKCTQADSILAGIPVSWGSTPDSWECVCSPSQSHSIILLTKPKRAEMEKGRPCIVAPCSGLAYPWLQFLSWYLSPTHAQSSFWGCVECVHASGSHF